MTGTELVIMGTRGHQFVPKRVPSQWASVSWETSPLAYPTNDEYSVTGGRRNNFQHGYITWYSANGTTQPPTTDHRGGAGTRS
jgi:uncharacterized protein with LGFP repeats